MLNHWMEGHFQFLIIGIFVLGFVFLCLLALRNPYSGISHRFLSRGKRRINLLETQVLDPQNRVVLVNFDYQEYLILVSPQGHVLLEKRTHEIHTHPQDL